MRNLANASKRVLEAATEQPIQRIPRQIVPQTDREYDHWAREQDRRKTTMHRKVARTMKGQMV